MTSSNRNLTQVAAIAVSAAAGALAVRAWKNRTRYSLVDKNVLLTGGSRGLGLVLAGELLKKGARVGLCARDELEVQRAIRELEQRGEVYGMRCDVSDSHDVERFVSGVRTRFGSIDVIINNAGVIQVGPLESMTLADFNEAMAIHFYGPLRTVLEVLPEMKSRGDGVIVNISSFGGKVAAPHLLPYEASKFALTGFSQGLNAELAKDGIHVLTVCPGLMRTGSHEQAEFKGRHEEEFAWFSIADSLPVVSCSAEHAAHRILRGIETKQSELTFPFTASWGVKLASLFPETYAGVLRSVNARLPKADDRQTKRGVKGWASHSTATPGWALALSEAAADRNNERHHEES